MKRWSIIHNKMVYYWRITADLSKLDWEIFKRIGKIHRLKTHTDIVKLLIQHYNATALRDYPKIIIRDEDL